MNSKQYKELVNELTPKENKLLNLILAFIAGGTLGAIGVGLKDLYLMLGNSQENSVIYMILTLIAIAAVGTALGWFDKLATIFKAGVLIPITGFSHATVAAAMDSKEEGLVMGVGANIFKLTGSVFVFGVLGATIATLIKLYIGG